MIVNTIVVSSILDKVRLKRDDRYYGKTYIKGCPFWLHEIYHIKNQHDLGRCFALMVF
jgi:hypothetical protein